MTHLVSVALVTATSTNNLGSYAFDIFNGNHVVTIGIENIVEVFVACHSDVVWIRLCLLGKFLVLAGVAATSLTSALSNLLMCEFSRLVGQ